MQGIVAYLLGGVVIHTRDTCRSVGVVDLLGGGSADSLDGRVAKCCASDFCTLLFGCLLCTAFGCGGF